MNKIICGHGQDKLTKMDEEMFTDGAAASCRIALIA